MVSASEAAGMLQALQRYRASQGRPSPSIQEQVRVTRLEGARKREQVSAATALVVKQEPHVKPRVPPYENDPCA